MTRIHPITIKGPGPAPYRILLPLYSDGFDFSLIAISDDEGKTWQPSRPLVSLGGVQPSLVQKTDGTVVAYMRYNGPPPNRVMKSESVDGGLTWSRVEHTDLPNPGSSLEVIRLNNGDWLMVGNDTEKGRHSLAALISDDEGQTWKWKRHLEWERLSPEAGNFSYPSVIQMTDGSVGVTYSYGRPGQGSAIKWTRFDPEWIKEGCCDCSCQSG
ncbi:MAG: glycoside hydrolase [Armatimonadetes bacterium]|nr:glycoside hydrolase [Armatimonadota bacterium]MDW8122459.1 sialidase family protein [Armatimonadota bacterium]